MSEVKTEFLTPVGRLVAGDCFRGNDKDAEGNPLVYKTGPNAGQPREEFYMGLAIPKTDPGVSELYNKILMVAKQSFPSLFDAQGNCISPKFAFKVTDGDSQVPNGKGIKPCDREGYPGHWVFSFSGGFASKCYSTGGASVLTDPESIKKGYYIRIYGQIRGNGSMQQPGIFLNHNMVELVAFGDVISSGPDGSAIFGGAPVGALPPGASATPLAPATTISQGLPGAAAAHPGIAAPVAAIPAVQPSLTTAATAATQGISTPAVAGVQPAPDFLNGPATNAAPVTPPAPVVEQFSVQGNVYTREQLLGFGWSNEQINTQQRV